MPKLINTRIQLQLHGLAGKETIRIYTIETLGDGMGSSGLPGLYGTIGASLALAIYALCDLCV